MKPLEQIKKISFIIRVRDAELDLKACLGALSEQECIDGVETEFIVVDNESKDNSVEIAESYHAKIITIKQSEFSWGKALNDGIEMASGDILIIVSADTIAENEHFVMHMVTPFLEDDSICAVYGRQIPKSDAPLDERVRLKRKFSSQYQVVDSTNDIDKSGKGTFFSNACGAIRKSLWRKLPYDEQIPAAEECVWTYEMLQLGYKSVYMPQAMVYHSHNDSIMRSTVRFIEFIYKSTKLQNKDVSMLTILHWCLSRGKSQIINCLKFNCSVFVKFHAFIRLPFEFISMIILYLFWDTKFQKSVRSFLWGK